MAERSKNYCYFYIAGFKYWDGLFVQSKLKVGQKLRLVPELDNPFDPHAIAIYRKKIKLGFVPRKLNEGLAQLLYFGHGEIFETYVAEVNLDGDPWERVAVSIRVKDAR